MPEKPFQLVNSKGRKPVAFKDGGVASFHSSGALLVAIEGCVLARCIVATPPASPRVASVRAVCPPRPRPRAASTISLHHPSPRDPPVGRLVAPLTESCLDLRDRERELLELERERVLGGEKRTHKEYDAVKDMLFSR